MRHAFPQSIPGVALRCAVFLSLIAGAGAVRAASYVGVGAGATPHVDTQIITQFSTGPETLNVKTGYGFEAQFGWEAFPWVDVEGALRYHLFSRGDSATYLRVTPTGHDAIGFEGGLRLHPRRGVTNSMPYLRFGIGSYSPTIGLSNGETISGDPVLGYFVGLGYVYEVSSFWGLDLRASGVVYNAFNAEQNGIELKAAILAITLSVIIF